MNNAPQEPGIDPLEQETGRRTLVKGAAWTIPAMALAVAAPAMAASNSCEARLNWSDFVRTDVYGGTGTLATSNGRTVGFTVSMDYSGSVTPADLNLTPRNQNTTGFAVTTETIQPADPPYSGLYSTMTIRFDAPVTDLSFNIHDIDRAEFVRVRPVASLNAATGSGLRTVGDWHGDGPSATNIFDPAKQLTVTGTGSITAVAIDFFESTPGGGIFIGSMDMNIC